MSIGGRKRAEILFIVDGREPDSKLRLNVTGLQNGILVRVKLFAPCFVGCNLANDYFMEMGGECYLDST